MRSREFSEKVGNLTIPRYRKSVILCIADKICAVQENVSGIRSKFGRKYEVLEY